MMIRLPLFLWLLLLVGCAGPRLYTQLEALENRPLCGSALAEMEQRIAAAGTRDRSAYPLKDFPYLRVNRFLASFARELNNQAEFQAWYRRLLRLGREGRAVELDNLPHPFSTTERQVIESCIAQLAVRDRAAPDFQARVQRQARVPSGYSTPMRVLGLFPLTRLVVLHQIERWNRTWGPAFNDPRFIPEPALDYWPRPQTRLAPDRIRRWLAEGRARSPLGIPALPEAQMIRLFEHFAPRWQIGQESRADRIGVLYWGDGGRPHVDATRPASYRLASYTRFGGGVLLQLNYMIWFEAQPAEGPLDIYAGHLDGLIWRVTLTPDGSVLAYDTIHACGCYHLLFPVEPDVAVRSLPPGEENPLIFSGAPDAREERILLRVTGTRHYLVGLTASPAAARQDAARGYPLLAYRRLLRLPQGEEGTRSLFGPEGRVSSSRRPERFLLWPMGVPSAGAMRQWGQHLISFTGRRQFDDPYLLQTFLQPVGTGNDVGRGKEGPAGVLTGDR